MIRASARTAAIVASLSWLLAASRPAEAAPTTVMFDAIATAGWRTSIDADDRAPGFQAVGGGGALFVGLAWVGVGPAIGGRARAGAVRGVTFVEAAGDLALQAQLGDRVRLRLGAEGGGAFLGPATAFYLGGFLEGLFDVVQLGGGRTALVFSLRMDLDDYLTDDGRFPSVSTEVGAGFGFRY